MIGQFSPSQLQAAVAAICPDIEARVTSQGRPRPTDHALWRELSCCLLSSQVPYALAQAAADKIDRVGALEVKDRRTREEVQIRIQDVLSSHFRVGSSWRRYRFPISRAEQLARTWAEVNERAGSLVAALEGFKDAHEVRSWLVDHAPGIGPKQASMFLRNVGVSYNLAILDRHVLNYMNALGLPGAKVLHISGLAAYHAQEAVLRDHATKIGYPVGLLDWAIWIVMRVANADSNRRLIQ